MFSEKTLMVIAILGAISEGLSLIPAIKANGVFQLLWGMLKAIMPAKKE